MDPNEIGVIHTDTKGNINLPSVDRHKYFLAAIDKSSHYKYIFPLQSKADATDELLKFIKRFEKQSGHVVRAVHTDGRTELNRVITILTILDN